MTRGTGFAALFATLLFAGPVWPQAGDIRKVHDPVVIREGGWYYMYSTGGTIPIRRSRDLYRWQAVGAIFPQLPAWARAFNPSLVDLWAPDISFTGGEYRLYYAVSTFGTNRSAIGLAVNRTLDPASASYRWEDRGRVLESRPGVDDWNAIDPNAVEDFSGKLWLAFGSYWSGIKLRALDPATGLLLASAPALQALAGRPGNTAIEGAFVFPARGWYYLFVSFDACCRGADSDYKTLVGRSRVITGPYTDRGGAPMTDGAATLVLSGYGAVRGPGHCAVLEDGGRSYLIHHYYDAMEGGIPKVHVRPLVFGPDDWPLCGEPLSGPPASPLPPPTAGTWIHSVDFGPGSSISLLPGGRIGSASSPDVWSVSGGFLDMRWPRTGAPGGAWLDRCVLSPDGRWYVGRNQNSTIVRGTKVESAFIRGDSNGDGAVDISDALLTLFHLFGGQEVGCLDALDANGDATLDVADPVFTLNYLFAGGRSFPAPFPAAALAPDTPRVGC